SCVLAITNFHLSVFGLWQRPPILCGFAAHFKIAIRLERNLADGALGGPFVAVVSSHDADRKWPVRHENDARIGSNGLQFSRLIRYLNILRQETRDVALLRRGKLFEEGRGRLLV